jgi:hypothetical protein
VLGNVAGTGLSIASLVLLESCAPVLSFTHPKMPRIGYLSPGPREDRETEWIDPFLQGLRDLGHVEGRT